MMQELPTEMGAEHVGIVQSLLEICRLHNIGPYDHFVDVLQRVKAHSPLQQMDELTPHHSDRRTATDLSDQNA